METSILKIDDPVIILPPDEEDTHRDFIEKHLGRLWKISEIDKENLTFSLYDPGTGRPLCRDGVSTPFPFNDDELEKVALDTKDERDFFQTRDGVSSWVMMKNIVSGIEGVGRYDYICVETVKGHPYAVFQIYFDSGDEGVFGVCLDVSFDPFAVWNMNIRYRTASKRSMLSLHNNQGDGKIVRSSFFLNDKRILHRILRLDLHLEKTLLALDVSDRMSNMTSDLAFALSASLSSWFNARGMSLPVGTTYTNALGLSVGAADTPLSIGVSLDFDENGREIQEVCHTLTSIIKREISHNGSLTVTFLGINYSEGEK